MLLSATALSVAVRVTALAPALSATLTAELLKLTVGAGSSSVIVIVSRWVPDSVAPLPPLTVSMSTITVSASSLKLSFTPVTVMLLLVFPAAIVIEEALRE